MLQIIQDTWPYLLALVSFVAASLATIHVVLHKRETRAAIGWVGLIWLSPLVGCVLYCCFGVNRIERKATSLRLKNQWHHQDRVSISEKDIADQRELIKEHPTFAGLTKLVQNLTDRPAMPGNSVQPLVNGDQAYPAMLAAINSAKKSITLASYIFDDDRAGDSFVQRLVEAKDRGVEIRILIDDVGARYSRPKIIGKLRRAGLTVATFLPTRIPRLFQYANLRNHRKILVVDGCIGFAGGTNIRDGHWLEIEPTDPIRCLHFRFEGPVVSHLQEAFAIDWVFATGEVLDGALWFPKIGRTAGVWARGISDGPDEDLDKIPFTIHGALAAAQESVYIMTPYFLPDRALVQALNAADLRGVDVRIVIPAKSNISLIHWATLALLPYLLEHGCQVYLSPPPFDHTKLMVVDGIWSLVGSSNWDPRSLRLNFEFNVECYSRELGAELESLVKSRIEAAREILLDELRDRSIAWRLRDGLARLFSPYL